MARTIYTGAEVFDGTGTPPAVADVAVEEGRIVEVGADLSGGDRVELTGKTLLPGLIDCHVHVTSSTLDLMERLQQPFSYQFFQAARNLARTLDCGITTVRDAGGADLGIRQAVEDGLTPGPRMLIAVTILSQTGGHGDGWLPSGLGAPSRMDYPGRPSGLVDGPEEIRGKVREIIRAGADVIKVCTSGGVLSPRDDPKHAHFRADELEMLVAEATAAGRTVMAHAQATDGIKNAVRAGIHSIEHGIYLDDEAIAMMLDAGTWLVPTLVAPKAVIDGAAAGLRVPEASVAKARDVMAAHHDSFARAVAAGVNIAMGTDSGVGPHGSNLDELNLMRIAGMAPADVLAATTSRAAELLGLAGEVGTIAAGRRADLVVVDGDPYDFPHLKENIAAVVKDGLQLRGARLAERP